MREDVHLPWARAWTKVMMARQMKANSPRTKDGSTFNGGDDDYFEED